MPKENLVNKSILADSIDSLSSNNLKSMRKEKKLTLGKLAELTRLSPSYLSRIEVGSRRMNTDILQKLSRILECHPSDLLDPRGRSSMVTKDLPVYRTQPGNQNVDFASAADQTYRP